MPDLPMSLPTLADKARRLELKRYFQFRFLNRRLSSGRRPMSGSVGTTISKSDMVGNRWNRVSIAFRSTVTSTFGWYQRHFEFRTSTDIRPYRPMSADVGSVTERSVTFENV